MVQNKTFCPWFGRILDDYVAVWSLDTILGSSPTIPKKPWKPPDKGQRYEWGGLRGYGSSDGRTFSPFLSALSKGFSNWIVETDAINVVNAIKKLELRSLEANVI
ncbi:hypothetical protein TIFTF001_021131 [Ficus carica]|uniref:Uncharacterized protein n=1 Tax=Ficus carica TaxID=3494 RepID=A0AA88AJV2_FICCA|nr:hypothetical protein TIFTF001_021131 [Ficus carica]